MWAAWGAMLGCVWMKCCSLIFLFYRRRNGSVEKAPKISSARGTFEELPTQPCKENLLFYLLRFCVRLFLFLWSNMSLFKAFWKCVCPLMLFCPSTGLLTEGKDGSQGCTSKPNGWVTTTAIAVVVNSSLKHQPQVYQPDVLKTADILRRSISKSRDTWALNYL